MADMASSIVTTIFDNCVVPIVRQFGYLWNHKKNIKKLESEVEKLDCVREDISRAVTVAERNAQIVRTQVNNWQNSAEEIRVSATEIIGKYEEDAKKRCLIGLCPNLVSLYRGSRKASKKQIEIVQVRTEATQFNVVADRTVGQVPATLSIKGYLTFDSRNSILEEIVKAMKEDTVNSIGVYGLGGMGKTTLAKQVALQAAEEKMFDDVVMAPVTQTPKLEEIQGEIAKSLDLRFDGPSVAERAGKIYKRMKEMKILVILDDLWEKLDLKKVGIPFGPEHKGCKLLFTSRDRDVLFSMGIKNFFIVEALGENEAWSLFAEKTVDVIKDPTFLSVGKEVAKKCAGLPVLIVTVAASLSSRPRLPAWKDALKELEKMNNKEVHEIVNSALESISYKHLQKTHKRLFLLCGLRGSGFFISDLLKYSWGWNFFDEDVVTLEEARNKLHTLILDLKAACLLLDGDNEDIINIHDVVRGVAISLARKDQNMLRVGHGDTESIKWPNDEVLRSCTAVFFDGGRYFSRLPQRLECPLLVFLLLRRIPFDASPTISDTFFDRTREIKVLDMTNICLPRLPSSLSFLENLQTLCLDCCFNLEDISMIGELKRLQVLSFIGADIKELPRGIGQLSELRLLDLTSCFKLEIIPAGLLVGLSNLEELYMRHSFNKWVAEEFHSNNSEKRSNVSLAELKHLPKLHSLEIDVEDAKLLSQDLNFERLERYRIIAGGMRADREIDKKGFSRRLGVNHLEKGIKGLKRAECLCLEELNGINNIVNELDRDGFTELKHLNIQTAYDIQFIVNVELKQQMAFPILESLYLRNLSKLEKICNGRLMQDSFRKLTTVKVRDCNKLESLFSFSMAIGLPCLQELQVSDCSILKGIVAKKSGDDQEYNDAISEKIEFAQLRTLSLQHLPLLRSFYCSVKEKHKYMKTGAQSEENVSEEEEPSSAMSLFKEANFPSLEELSVKNCTSLKYLFTSSIATGLVRLQQMTIKRCPIMKKIIVNEEKEETTTNIITMPHLSHLCLEDLPNLVTFYSGKEEMCSNENIDIQTLFNDKVNLPVLKILEIDNLDNIESIWHNRSNEEYSFCKLEDVDVRRCAKLLNIFSSTMLNKIQSVETVVIHDCDALEEVFEVQKGLNPKGISNDVTIVSRLTKLNLSNLPKLKFAFKIDFHTIFSFENLCDVEVLKCESLKSVFPAYVAQRLHQLEKLHIEDGMEVETIVEEDNDGDHENKEVFVSPTTFTFPKLIALRLVRLPKVECFYPKKHASEWPLLNVLEVNDCDQISILELLNFSGNQQHNQFKKLSSDLKRVTIRSKEMKMMTRQYSEVFLNLKELRIIGLNGDESAVFPFNFLYGLHSLEELRIEKSSFGEIFPYEQGQEETFPFPSLPLLPHLTSLTLRNLPELKFMICTQNSPFFPILHKLKRLCIIGCPRLTNLVPTASVSFKWLTHLIVKDCDGLINLIPSSTAASLEQLQWLTIGRCSMMEEIVAADHGDLHSQVDDEIIIFSKLWHLELEELLRLTSFCTANSYTFKFPALIRVIVRKCPNMSTFSPGITITPMLKTVSFGDAKLWKGDLNATIQQFCSEREPQRLTTTDPSTSSNNHVEPEAHIHEKPIESLGKKAEDIPENVMNPENEIEVREQREGVGIFDKCEEPRKVTDICEEEVIEDGICRKATEPGKFADSCVKGKGKEPEICDEEVVESAGNEGETSNRPCLESNISEKSHPYSQGHADGSSRIMPFIQHGESSFPPLSDPSSRSPANEPEEQTNGDLNTTVQHLYSEMEDSRQTATIPSTSSNNYFEPEAQIHDKPTEYDVKEAEGSAVPRREGLICEKVTNPEEENKVCDNAIEIREKGKGKGIVILEKEVLEPTHIPVNKHEEQTDAGSLAPRDAVASSSQTSHSQQKDVQGSIPLLSKFLQILQTQPLNSMRSEQFQFIEDAFRDLSNISIDWFSPYVEKARECSSVVDRRKKISEIEAQLQALKQEKRALEEKNDAVTSRIDFDKTLHDN